MSSASTVHARMCPPRAAVKGPMRDPRIPPFEPVFQTLERQSPRVLVRSRGLVVVAGARNYLQTKRRFEGTTEDPAPTTARRSPLGAAGPSRTWRLHVPGSTGSPPAAVE